MRGIFNCVMAIAFAIAISLPASAQSVFEIVAGLKFCRTLKDDGQRLKCFDGLVAEKKTEQRSSQATEPEVEVTWTIKEDKSPVDDSPQVSGTLEAANAGGSLMGHAGLFLRCREKQTDAIFAATSTYLGNELIKVFVRINDGKTIETRWTPSTGGQGVFAPNAIQFIRSLPDNGKLFVRAFGYGGRTVDGEFKLGNVSEVREKIALACKWPAEPTRGLIPKNTTSSAKPEKDK